MTTIFSNISGIAALAIIVGGVGAIFVQLIASVLGRPLDASAQQLVNTLINVMIGLAVGASAAGTAVTLRMARAMELEAESRAEPRAVGASAPTVVPPAPLPPTWGERGK